jgi:hypothetical protein
MAEDALARFGLGIKQEAIFQTQQIDVSQDVSLRVQEEGVASRAGRELLDVIGGHGVQKAGAVVAADINAAASGVIQPGGGGA